MIDFFEFSNEMLCLADRRGYFTRVNKAWTATLGWSSDELISRPYFDFVHPEDLEATNAEARQLFTGNYETIRFENRYRHRDGSYRWLAWYAKAEPASDHLVAAARDVTEQKLQAESLRLSEERLRLVMEATNDAIWDIDLQTNIVWWNETYVKIFGLRPPDSSRSSDWWLEHLHPEDRERAQSSFQEAVAGQAYRWSCEYRYRRMDGDYAYVLDRALITRDAQGRALRVLGAMQDITLQKQTAEEVRTQSQTIQHLFYLQDLERKLISYDIHDGLAQLIAGASLQVEAARGNPMASSQALEIAGENLRKAIAESRRLINDLRPLIIDERGIGDSIEHLAADYAEIFGCRIECSIDVQQHQTEPLFDGVVFRIVQESIANAVEHGRATKIQVRVEQVGNTIRLEIHDNGCGFDIQQVAADRFGIRGIRERAKIYGGDAKIESQIDQGTDVRVWLKIPEQRATLIAPTAMRPFDSD